MGRLVNVFPLGEPRGYLALGVQPAAFARGRLNLIGELPVVHVGMSAFPALPCVRATFGYCHDCLPSISSFSWCSVQPMPSVLRASICQRPSELVLLYLECGRASRLCLLRVRARAHSFQSVPGSK